MENSSSAATIIKDKQRIMKLDEILIDEHIVLVDSSAFQKINVNFGDKLYLSNVNTGVERTLLKDMSLTLDNTLEILGNPNVYTIPEVVKEFGSLLEIISCKCTHFSENKGRINPYHRKHTESFNYAKDRLSNLQEKGYAVQTLAKEKDLLRNKAVPVEDYQFDAILKMVKLIDSEIGLKKDTSFIYGRHERDMSRDSDTDERLVSYAYCTSMFSEKKPVILTKDTDFVRLLGVTPRLMGADNLLPDNELFRRRICENPVLVCCRVIGSPDEYRLAIDGTNLRFDDSFRLYKATPERNEQLKKEMVKLWKDFSLHG